jgi:hypothetical protein
LRSIQKRWIEMSFPWRIRSELERSLARQALPMRCLSVLAIVAAGCASQSAPPADLPRFVAAKEIKAFEIEWGHRPDADCPRGVLLVHIHAQDHFYIGALASGLQAGPVEGIPLWGNSGVHETWALLQRPPDGSILSRGMGPWAADRYSQLREGGCALRPEVQAQFGK